MKDKNRFSDPFIFDAKSAPILQGFLPNMIGTIPELVLDTYLITRIFVNECVIFFLDLGSFIDKWKITFKKCIMDRNILTLEMMTI